MNKQRLVILIIAVLGILAIFMPWVTVPLAGSIIGIKVDYAWLTLVLYAVPAVLSFLNDRSKPLEGIYKIAVIISGLICSGIAIKQIINFYSIFSGTEDNPFASAIASSISIGIGMYIVVICGIAIACVAFLLKGKTATE